MHWLEFDEDEEIELLKEFEDMLEDQFGKKIEKKDPSKCYHVWEQVGEGPVTGTPWINCKKCSIKKEDHDKEEKNPKRSQTELFGMGI